MAINPKKKIKDTIAKGGKFIPKAKSVFAGGMPVPLSLGGIGAKIEKAAINAVKGAIPAIPSIKPPTIFIEGVPVPKLPSILQGKLPKLPGKLPKIEI